MLLRRFYDDKLAQASYLIGCQAAGEALVVDPNRDVESYLAAAAEEGVAIRYVSDTHIHADYLSGARELARRAGATLLLSGDGPPEWRYAFTGEDGTREVHEGDEVRVGSVVVRVLHTPGHTPEHISFLITDAAASAEPLGLLTGDFLFVGDVGRPDLLERAAGIAGATEEGARALYRSLERLRALPPHLQVLPGHGAGSACGRAPGAVPTSTLGYEHLANWAFRCATEDEFLAEVLRDQPEPPTYFARMKRMNRDGPALLGRLPDPPRLGPAALAGVLGAGGVVVDTRSHARFAAGHVPGTLSVPLGRSFPDWCGWLLPYDRPVHLVAEGPGQAREAARDLALIGLDRTAGFFGPEDLGAWGEAHGGLAGSRVVDWAAAEEAAAREGGVLVDVRRRTEWNEGRVPGARHIHLGTLRGRAGELPRDVPILLYCRTDNRSAIGASLLRAEGFSDVRNVAGGIVDRAARGLPVERGPT